MQRTLPFLLVALLLAAVPAQGQINGDHPFEAEYDYADPVGGAPITVVSGAMEAELSDAWGTFGFFGVDGFALKDLDRVCWDGPSVGRGCAIGNPLTLTVGADGSVGMRLPDPVDGTYTADHVLALWMDFDSGEDLNSYLVDKALLAPSVGGRMAMGAIADIPLQNLQQSGTVDAEEAGGLAPLDEDTTIRLDGVTFVQGDGCAPPGCSFQDKDVRMSFEGSAVLEPFDVDFGLLPFGAGSATDFRPASDAATAEGLRFARINEMLGRIEQANQQHGNDPEPQQITGAEDLEVILQETLNGALLRFPVSEAAGQEFSEVFRINRFETLAVADDGAGLHGEGDTVFRVADGSVTGAQPLYGVWLFKLPWWGFLLWAAAIGLFIARMTVKPDKHHERWDRYKWIGLVFALLMALLVFVLWDIEMAHVFGTSIFTTDASGTTFWVAAGIQVATLSLVYGVVAAPLQIIIKNGLLLGKQGTFMGLGTGTGILLSYLLGATLLLSYLDLMLGVVL